MTAPDDVVLIHDGRARVRRGASAAAVSTLGALMAHVAAGGAMPGPLGVAFPLLLATLTCSLLAGVRMPWLRLGVSVAASQLLFHTLFVLGAMPPSSAGSSLTSSHGHLGHDVVLAATSDADAHLGHASGSMWLAHAAAALVTVLALRRGEIVLIRARQVLGRLASRHVVVRLPEPPVLAHRPAAPIPDERAWTSGSRAMVSTPVARRGPPRALVSMTV
jgi:hypothetical protein